MRSPTHNVGGWLARRAELTGERTALIDDHRQLDYASLEERCRRATGLLRGAGIEAGDRVALLLANRSAFLELVFALARLGAISVPINTRLAAAEIRQILDDCTPRALFHEASLGELAEKACCGTVGTPSLLVPAGGEPDAYETALAASKPCTEILPVAPEDPMILMYTSGTTGVPKGALLPHRKTLFNTLNAQLFFDLTARDRVLTVVPLFHSYGLKILSIPTLYAGGTVVLQSHFDPEAVWRAVGRHGITFFGGVPSMFRTLEETLSAAPEGSFELDSLRFLFTAGAPIPVELIRAFAKRKLVLKQGFGLTETSILCCLDAADAIRKAGSVGRPVFHAELRIVRTENLQAAAEAWRDCTPGEIGEIVVRGPITMLGYWNQPTATAETLRDGWVRTGDLACFDDEGFVTLTDRDRDMLISGGENVYPRQVERVYEEHPQVREIAVVGVPDRRWGEVGRAFVVLEEGAELDPAALRRWGRERLAAFKVPQQFVQIGELPKTATGKVQKFKLR